MLFFTKLFSSSGFFNLDLCQFLITSALFPSCYPYFFFCTSTLLCS